MLVTQMRPESCWTARQASSHVMPQECRGYLSELEAAPAFSSVDGRVPVRRHQDTGGHLSMTDPSRAKCNGGTALGCERTPSKTRGDGLPTYRCGVRDRRPGRRRRDGWHGRDGLRGPLEVLPWPAGTIFRACCWTCLRSSRAAGPYALNRRIWQRTGSREGRPGFASPPQDRHVRPRSRRQPRRLRGTVHRIGDRVRRGTG